MDFTAPIHLLGVYWDFFLAVINSSQILAAVRVNVGSVLWF